MLPSYKEEYRAIFWTDLVICCLQQKEGLSMRKKWQLASPGMEDTLARKSFAELFWLQQEGQCRLNALRRKEPREENRPDYTIWIGWNAACIADLEKIRKEIRSRKERADRAGVNVFAFDGKTLRN